MLVRINTDAFNGNDYKGLNYLIQILTYDGRYELFVELVDVQESTLYNNLDTEDKRLIEAYYNDAILKSIQPSHFVGAISDSRTFDISEAIRFFGQPVSIILENSRNDSWFIRKIINYFDSTKDVQKHLDKGWIQFENAGGCTNVQNFIVSKLQSFDFLPKEEKHTYLRAFVLLDSDRNFENENLKNEYKTLKVFFEKNKISYHVLNKRSMENYMPERGFNLIINEQSKNADLIKWLNVYKTLNKEQKDYLKINGHPFDVSDRPQKKKRKLTAHRNTENQMEIPLLYRNVSIANLKILKGGFPLRDFKNKFPEYFNKPELDKQSLQERCGDGELDSILLKISNLI